jgi:hypothetical protein
MNTRTIHISARIAIIALVFASLVTAGVVTAQQLASSMSLRAARPPKPPTALSPTIVPPRSDCRPTKTHGLAAPVPQTPPT